MLSILGSFDIKVAGEGDKSQYTESLYEYPLEYSNRATYVMKKKWKKYGKVEKIILKKGIL